MKPYKKPEIISEQVLEKVALSCDGYIYYAKDYEGCKEEYLGMGKDFELCFELHS